jgi:hypothetical protein
MIRADRDALTRELTALRTEAVGLAVLLGRGEAGRIHRRELRSLRRERLPRRAEVQQHGRAVSGALHVQRRLSRGDLHAAVATVHHSPPVEPDSRQG